MPVVEQFCSPACRSSSPLHCVCHQPSTSIPAAEPAPPTTSGITANIVTRELEANDVNKGQCAWLLCTTWDRLDRGAAESAAPA